MYMCICKLKEHVLRKLVSTHQVQTLEVLPFTLGGVSVAVDSFLLLGIDHSVCCDGVWLRTLFFGVGRFPGLNTLMVGAVLSSSFRFCGGVELALLLLLVPESSLLLASSSCFLILSRMSAGTGWVACRVWRVRRARDRRLMCVYVCVCVCVYVCVCVVCM